MNKQIIYFDSYAKDPDYPNGRKITVTAYDAEEYAAHRAAILDPSRGITLIDPTELPEEPDPAWFISIDDLKTELASTDYKIIKCSEYQLMGLDMPYDITELHKERQILRNKINELEVT